MNDRNEYDTAYVKHHMALARQIGVTQINLQLAKQDKIRDLKNFWKFPWEEERKVHIPTKAGWRDLDRKYRKKNKV